MKIANILTITTLIACMAVPTHAEALRCKFKPGSPLPDQVEADFDLATRAATVRIPGVADSDTRATVAEASSKRTVVAWELIQADRRGTSARLAFRLVHFKKNGRGLLRMQAIGYDNQYTTRGTCRVQP